MLSGREGNLQRPDVGRERQAKRFVASPALTIPLMIACSLRAAPKPSCQAPRPRTTTSLLQPQRHSSRQFRAAAALDSHPEPSAAAAPAAAAEDDDAPTTQLRKEPNVVDWAALRADIQANADANYLFDEGDDDDDEDEDIIYYRHQMKGGEAAEVEEPEDTGDARWVERQLVASADLVESPVPGSTQPPGGPEPLVSSYSSSGGFRELAPDELHTVMQLEDQANRSILLLDIRSPADYTAGRVAGAYNVPFPQLSEIVRSGLLDGWKQRTLVVLGDSDLTSAQTSVRLRRVFGFDAVVCVRGGMPAWMLAGLPYESGPDEVDWSAVFSSPV